MADEPRWIWKKKVLLYCLQLSKLKKDDLISIANDFDLASSGLKDELVYNIQHHIQSNLGSPSLSKDAIQRMIQRVEPVTPHAVLHEIKSMTQATRPVLPEAPRNNTPVAITGLLSDAIRNKHKSSNPVINNSRPHVTKNTSLGGRGMNSYEINTNPRHENVSYSFPEVPFYPRVKLLDDPYISPITNRKLKKTFHLDLTKDQYKGLQENQYKIFFFCGAIPISIDLDDEDDEDDATDSTNKGKHEIIPISFPQTYQFINMRTGESLEKHSMSNKKDQRSKPIDVTDLLSPKQRLGNSPLQFSFHFVPAAEYYMSIYLVNVIKTEDIVNKICEHTRILSNATLYYLKKSQNPDNGLLATSIIISLECPISGSIMKVPVKSTKCLHIECFDAFWYLQSQRQVANGRCPICSKFIKTEDLAVSEFIEDILSTCPSNCRKVQLTNDGNWDPIIESDDEDLDIDSDGDDDEGYGFPPSKKQKPSSPNKTTTPPPYIEPVVEVRNTNEAPNHNNKTAIPQNTFAFNIVDPDSINVMTPTNNKIKDNISFNSEVNSTTNSPSTSHLIPNILGSTPLNKNNYKGLPTTKTFHNLAAMSAPLQEDNSLIEQSASPLSMHNPTILSAYPQKNSNGNIDYLPQAENAEFDHDVSMSSTYNNEETVVHGNMENIDSTLSNTSTGEKASCPPIPKLPDLPTLPSKFIQEQPQNYSKYSTSTTKKLIIVPFNANLSGPHGNVLPQKRRLSRTPTIIKQPLNK